MLHLFIGAWLTLTPVKDIEIKPDTTVQWVQKQTESLFFLEFSEPMDTTGLRDKNNYSITDNTGKKWIIKYIAIVTKLNGTPITDNKLVCLITDRVDYKKTYHIVVTGVRDLAGNYIQDKNDDYYYFAGIKPSLQKPIINIKNKE